MKNMTSSWMKTVAAVGLSVCVMVGGSLPSFAAYTTTEEVTCKTDSEIDCDYAKFKVTGADGKTKTVKICTFCGDVSTGGDLTEVTEGVFSNYANITLYQGTLENGMEVLNISFSDPAKVEYTYDEDNAIITETTLKDQKRWGNELTASIEVPKELVEGYTLMRINADGSETPLSVSVGAGKASFTVTVEDGACLIHLVPNEG